MRHIPRALGREAARRPELLTLAAFAALALLFFWRLWSPDPADRQVIGGPDGDFLRQFYPYRAFVARAWASLAPPLWNPHQYAGTPAWADPQLAVLYPWRWLQLPFALGGRVLPLWTVQLEAVAHVALGGWFTFLLLRRLGAGPAGAALAGLSFAFGGYLTGFPVEQLAVLDTAVWIPATLWALTAATAAAAEGERRGARRWAMGAGLATACSLLAGHPQTALYGLYAGLAWLAWRAHALSLGWRGLARLGGLWLALAAGLSAPAWLPTLDFLARSARGFDYAARARGLALADLAQLLVPVAKPLPGQAAPPWQWSPLYVGVVALVLALWALAWLRPAWPWLAGAGLAWLAALGGAGPLYPILDRLAPGFALFRQQERIAVLVSLGLAVAAGLALGALPAAPPRARRWAPRLALVLAAACAALAAAGVAGPAAGPLSAFADGLAFSALMAALAALPLLAAEGGRLSWRAASAALVLIALLDLASVNRGRVLAAGGNPFPADRLVTALLAHARDGRVSSEGLLPGGPNAASVHGLFDTTGDSPLQLGASERLVRELPELVWWRLLGVRYLLSERAFPPGAPLRPIAEAGGRRLYELQMAVPPAWVPARVTRLRGEWRPGPDFDPHQEAVLSAAAGVPDLDTGPGGGATLTGLGTDRVAVDAQLPRPGLVVASVAYDPGWRATARGPDGARLAPATVPAYGALLAVALPAGSWQVEWTYRPKGVSFALIVAGVTMLVALGLWRWP